jgi:acetamidase/formamidase
MPTGGNLENKRIGIPVEVAGGLVSMGDAHTAQGDSELDGTGIKTSLTGSFKLTVIKKADFFASQEGLNFPLGETSSHWIIHGFTKTDYLETYFDNQGDIYSNSNIDARMPLRKHASSSWLSMVFPKPRHGRLSRKVLTLT